MERRKIELLEKVAVRMEGMLRIKIRKMNGWPSKRKYQGRFRKYYIFIVLLRLKMRED